DIAHLPPARQPASLLLASPAAYLTRGAGMCNGARCEPRHPRFTISYLGPFSASSAQIRQESGEETQGRQIGADLIDEIDVGEIRELAEHRGTDAAEAEGEAEEEPRHHADLPWN